LTKEEEKREKGKKWTRKGKRAQKKKTKRKKERLHGYDAMQGDPALDTVFWGGGGGGGGGVRFCRAGRLSLYRTDLSVCLAVLVLSCSWHEL
jgi:hypothetical protein